MLKISDNYYSFDYSKRLWNHKFSCLCDIAIYILCPIYWLMCVEPWVIRNDFRFLSYYRSPGIHAFDYSMYNVQLKQTNKIFNTNSWFCCQNNCFASDFYFNFIWLCHLSIFRYYSPCWLGLKLPPFWIKHSFSVQPFVIIRQHKAQALNESIFFCSLTEWMPNKT